MIPLLDHGYLKLIETWGSDIRIIEAARMSTDKGFQGWGPIHAQTCPVSTKDSFAACSCEPKSGDEKLLRYLYEHQHMTPFEMAGMVIEVQAPIFVFREWHRHRTQSYNELSARYTPLPDLNYIPSRERIIDGAKGSGNRQAAGTKTLATECIDDWLKAVDTAYAGVELTYQTGLEIGIPKEIARIVVPVGRYSRMRASANLRNWLGFLLLRMDATAQYEIRVYANAVAELVKEYFPRTFELFDKGRHV